MPVLDKNDISPQRKFVNDGIDILHLRGVLLVFYHLLFGFKKSTTVY